MVLILCLLGLFLSVAATAAEPLREGCLIPVLKLPDLENKTVDLTARLGSKPVIILFYASWSKSCTDELKFLNNLYKSYKDDLEIWAVSFDNKVSEAQGLVNEEKITVPVLSDKNGKCLDKFQILIIPKLFILDKSGYIVKIFDDFDENIEKLIDREIKKLVAKK